MHPVLEGEANRPSHLHHHREKLFAGDEPSLPVPPERQATVLFKLKVRRVAVQGGKIPLGLLLRIPQHPRKRDSRLRIRTRLRQSPAPRGDAQRRVDRDFGGDVGRRAAQKRAPADLQPFFRTPPPLLRGAETEAPARHPLLRPITERFEVRNQRALERHLRSEGRRAEHAEGDPRRPGHRSAEGDRGGREIEGT